MSLKWNRLNFDVLSMAFICFLLGVLAVFKGDFIHRGAIVKGPVGYVFIAAGAYLTALQIIRLFKKP